MVSPGGQRAGGRVLARRYHLKRVLGRGAMGAVWEAEDTFLRRTVAVKEVVLPGSLSPEERAVSCERTLREARAIARLGHPNVVTLFDVLDEDARPWVVMELVPSRSLAEVIKEDGPLHPLRVATVGLAILGALEAAHAAGITHRDVKPGNILLGHDGRVKLTDFGIARAAGDDTITGTGLLVGSPSYIAPEIVKGMPTGAPADMWGLGATLYAAVEGRAPFSGGDAMETLSKVVQEPQTPYERAGPLIPALDAMLEKDPVRRARPVEARRALLDVLRGGTETESPVRPAPPVAVPEPARGPETGPGPTPGSDRETGSGPASESGPASGAGPAAAGPGLADLLVPVWRQGRSEEPLSGPPEPQPARPSAEKPAASGPKVAPDGAAAPVGGLAAAAAGAMALRRGDSDRDGASAPAGPSGPATPDTTQSPPVGRESVAGSSVGGRGRDVLADDADLVDPHVADPDLVGMDASTSADLGVPLEPIGTPQRPPAEQTQAGADPDATVTLPSRPGGSAPSGSPRTPAYGSYGGRDDLRTQRIAPLPFGSAPAEPQQPARAFRPQPPSPPPDFQDERSRGDRSKRGLAALLVVAVLVVAVLGGFLLFRNLRGGGSPSASGPPSATASLGPATIPTGFSRYAGTGYTVGIPAGWPPKARSSGVVDARDPGSARFIRLITVDSTASALSQLTTAEQQFENDPTYGSYQRLKLRKIDYRGLDAADWEFTFTLDGEPRHVLYRGIVSNGRTFGLYLSTPADKWTGSTNVFQVAATTFRTG